MQENYAVIDYGTNSARLMIASFNGQKIQTHYKHINSIRIGDGMDRGIITDGAMQRAKDATLDFQKTARFENVKQTYIFATSAVRDAKNSKDMIDYIKEHTGLTIDIISGKEEADIGYIGATYGRKEDEIGILDIGGGSTEVVFGKNDTLTFAKSFNIGIVRLLQKYPDASPQNLKLYDECTAYIKEVFSKIPKSLYDKSWLGIGGTATSMAAIVQNLKIYDPKKVHNYYLSNDVIQGVCDEMKNQTIEQRKNIRSLEEKRADVIVFGAVLLHSFLQVVNAQGIIACESDNLEGYLIKKLGLV